MKAETFPQILKLNHEKWGGHRVAMRKKDLGIWEEYTWKEVYEHTKYFCLGLASLGLERGEKVAILGDNDPEWYWAEFAVQALGGVVAGIFVDCVSSEVLRLVDHSDARFTLAKDQEQVDKLLRIKDQVPNVRKVIYWDPKGMRGYDDPWLIRFEEVEDLGRKREESSPGFFEQQIALGKGDDVAVICYTSGTTKQPKGALLTYKNLLANFEAGYGPNAPLETYDTDQYVSFFPAGYIAEQGLGIPGMLITGAAVNFPEEPETVQEDIREIGPPSLLYTPRFWEGIASSIQARMEDSDPIKRTFYEIALRIGYKKCDLEEARMTPNLLWSILYRLANRMVFRQIRDHLGMAKLRWGMTGGAALGPDCFRFFRALGVNLIQGYGVTETSPGIVFHRLDDVRYETVGKPHSKVEVKISEEGEILVRGDTVFAGYHKDPAATAEALAGGWFHTGDAGYITEDGHLVCIDRVNDLLQLSDGEKWSPTYTENRIKFSPYIKDVMVVGGADRHFIVALVVVDFDILSRWAEKNRLVYTTMVDLSQKPEVYDLVQKDIERVNQTLPERARVRRFVNLHKELDADEAELTRTRKLRRGFMEERYRDLVEALYRGEAMHAIETHVLYQDGRKGVLKTVLTIRDLKSGVAQ